MIKQNNVTIQCVNIHSTLQIIIKTFVINLIEQLMLMSLKLHNLSSNRREIWTTLMKEVCNDTRSSCIISCIIRYNCFLIIRSSIQQIKKRWVAIQIADNIISWLWFLNEIVIKFFSLRKSCFCITSKFCNFVISNVAFQVMILILFNWEFVNNDHCKHSFKSIS